METEGKNKIAQEYGWKNWDAVISDYSKHIITYDIFSALCEKANVLIFYNSIN